MRIFVDEEGRTVVMKLIDSAIRTGGMFASLRDAAVVANSVAPVPKPREDAKPEEEKCSE